MNKIKDKIETKIKFTEPWSNLWTKSKYFEEELEKELNKSHVLYGVKVKCIGRREDKEDFLFELQSFQYKFAVVHLTFTGKPEEDKKYPITQLYKTIEDFITNRMNLDVNLY